jgi:hypothetical protein
VAHVYRLYVREFVRQLQLQRRGHQSIQGPQINSEAVNLHKHV